MNNRQRYEQAMGRKQGKPKKRYKKKRKDTETKPVAKVPKPCGEHMPLCTTTGCNRRVNDARKLQCKVCSKRKTAYNRPNPYGDYDIY